MGRDEETGHQKVNDNHGKVGFLALPEAPVFYPSEAEFTDPLNYIEQIRPEAEPYGICRIVPPKSWNPPFAIDKKSFAFPTKLQEIHQLQMRPAARDAETFRLEYCRFLEKEGLKPASWPSFLGKELDLCKLFGAVKRHGGYQKVMKESKWGEVLQILDPSYTTAAQTNSLQSALCKMYEAHLHAYETHKSSSTRGKRCRNSNVQEAKFGSRGRKAGRRCIDEFEALKGEEVSMDDTDLKADQVCEQCHTGAHEQLMLLCDRCDRGWHLYCLTPPLAAVPPGNWYCFDCLTSETESFGFTPGEVHDFESFRRVADRFKKKWFGTKEVTASEIEEEFWSVVERCKGPVEVLYGSDLASEVYGSGFPRTSDPVPEWADENLWKQYASSPWNLNNFTKLKGSVLKHVQENIPGVTVPWVYMGMLFSSFCWHYEDQCFYSINYLHWGEPKCWYGVPGSAINSFEQVMHKTFPDLFEAQPDLLFQLVTMLNPKVLCEHDVPVYTTIQECGNFVITFPRSYHGGFNHGLNCAEAVNFATLDWLPLGRFGVERARLYHKAAVLSHEELLCVIAKNADGYKNSSCLKEELTYMIALEKKQRIRLWRAGIIHSSRMAARQYPEVIGTEEDPVCIICRYYLFMSALTCSCCPGKAVCLQHSEQLCECSKDRQRLLYRYSLAELDDLQLEVRCPDIDQSPLNSGPKGRHRRRYKQSESIMSMKKVNGGIVSLSKLADTWLVKAEDVISKTPKLSSVQSLLVEAEEFLWGGHEMDRLRSVEKELQSAESWAQGVAACLNAAEIQAESKEANLEKGLLTTAQELLVVNPAPCDMEDSVSKLKKFMAVAIDLQKQVKVLLSTSPPWKLSDLEELQEKVVQSPLLFSEAKELEDIVTSIKAWRAEVQNILSEPQLSVISGKKNATDMNKLYKLQMEAQKLPVSMPELQALDVFINKLENWQERAKALMQTVVPLQVAEKLLMEIENVPVFFTEAEALQRRLYRAKEWIKSTHKVLADIHHQSYYSASIEMLLSLVKLGKSLKLEVKEIDLIKAELKKLLWLERAAKVLEHQSTYKELVDMLEEATELSLHDEKLYLKLSQVAEAAAAWERRAFKILLNGGSLDEYRSLRRDSSKIYVSLSGWVGINASIMQAESFLHHAQPFLDQSQHSNSNLKLELLQDLISQSCSLRVHLPERDHLCAVLADVKAWRNKALVLMNSAKVVLKESHFNNTDLSLEEKSTMIIKSRELMADLRNVVDGGQIFRFELPEIAELKVLVTAMEWHLKVSQSLLEYPTIQELDCLVQEATAFGNYVGQLELLQGVLRKGKEWSMKVRSALELNGSSLRCTVQDLENLISEAKAMKINLSKDVTYLQQLLMSHRSWLKKISQYLFPPKLPVSWQELCHFQAIRKTHPIACDEADLLEKELLKSEAWVLKCFNKLLGKSEGISFTLIELLSKVRMSVDCALQQLYSKASEEKERVCRLCRKHVDAASFSCLKCDNCKDSYHGLCLGFDNSQERGQKQFVCSFCNAFTAGILWLDEGILSKICITKRPTVGALQDLLEAGKGINIRMEEIQLLQGIVRRVQAWHTCLHEIIEPVLRPHSNETYSSSSLLSALKIAGTMEVQGDGNSKLALALSVNAWRMHARSIVESSTKPSYRTVCRILKEGLAIPCLSHDCLLKELESWEAMASEWVNEANKAIEDNGLMPLEDVLELIVEGERLPVAFSKEIADLRSRTVLYCICRKPYDKDRAMIACDSCSEWYHFDCVNLPDPDSSDDECEAMLQRHGSSGEFLCPNCKPVDSRDNSSLIKLVNQRSSNIEPVKELNDISQKSLYTPPLWYARGKRSSRSSSVRVRAGLQEKWQSHNKILYCSEGLRKGRDRSKTCINSSGRPCRRTAGQHSRFESFVLLMHSG